MTTAVIKMYNSVSSVVDVVKLAAVVDDIVVVVVDVTVDVVIGVVGVIVDIAPVASSQRAAGLAALGVSYLDVEIDRSSSSCFLRRSALFLAFLPICCSLE